MQISQPAQPAQQDRVTQYVVIWCGPSSGSSADAARVTVPIATFKTLDEAADHVRQLVIDGARERGQGPHAYACASSYFIWETRFIPEQLK